jgi:hypothetical protein
MRVHRQRWREEKTSWGHGPPPSFPQKDFLRSNNNINNDGSPQNKLIGSGLSPKKFLCFLLLF